MWPSCTCPGISSETKKGKPSPYITLERYTILKDSLIKLSARGGVVLSNLNIIASAHVI